MAGGIFVSYRRDDARQAAGRLADDLSDHFGATNIFRDIEGIELGVDFVDALNRALEICVVMLVLIGPRWLNVKDAAGNRRLEDPNDWIRQEISTALQRGIRVVPVLVDGTELPAETDLPEDLRTLVRRQALDIADGRWRGDLQRLVETLARVPGLALQKSEVVAPPPEAAAAAPSPAAKPAGRKWGKYVWIGVAILVIGYMVEEFDTSGGGVPMPTQPQFAPNSAPQPQFAPNAANPAPNNAKGGGVPDMSGLWRTTDGETYQITQRGNQLDLTAHAAGQRVGSGKGQIDGNMLRVSLAMVINGIPLATANCNLQGNQDFSHFSGSCQGPNGQFIAQMFR